MKYSVRAVFIAVALLAAPIASHGQQCDLPTKDDVESAGGAYLESTNTQGSVDITMSVQNMHFTCLARVAFDKYSFASVVVNSTASNNPDVPIVRQFQLQCSFITSVWGVHQGNVFDSNIPSMPFDIEADLQCAVCEEKPPETLNYNTATNCECECVYLGSRGVSMNLLSVCRRADCDPVCRGMGGGFCTGMTVDDCCPFFNSDTGACVKKLHNH